MAWTRFSTNTHNFKVQPFPKRTHIFRDEVAPNLDVLLSNDSCIGRNNRIQPEKQKFKGIIKRTDSTQLNSGE